MDSSEYGYHRVEAYIMTYPFYISLLNSNLKKNYADVFRCGHRRIKICMIAISGYPIFLSDKFSDKYAFSEVLMMIGYLRKTSVNHSFTQNVKSLK